LLANSDKETNCAQRGHGHCRIAHMIMKLMTKRDLAKLCTETAERSGKTAMHLAVSVSLFGHKLEIYQKILFRLVILVNFEYFWLWQVKMNKK